jgi:hypothetical protein
VARQLVELSAALAERNRAFSKTDSSWLSGTTKKILRLANQLPSRYVPLVAVNCDTVLVTIESDDAHGGRLVASSSHRREPSPTKQPLAAAHPATISGAAPEKTDAASRPTQALLPREFATSAVRSIATLRDRGKAGAKPNLDVDAITALTSITPGERLARNDSDVASHVLEWSRPLIFASPAMPIHVPTVDIDQSSMDLSRIVPVAVADETGATTRPLDDVDSRELLRRWLECDESEACPLEEELTYRGFGRLSAQFAERLLSPHVADRLQLVDDVLIEPGIDARPWLVLLADDVDPDVRLLVVTIMATSDDPMLLEKAWQVAISDRDPRVASLAGRLRHRRSNVRQ